MGQPRPFFRLFSSFQTNFTIVSANMFKNVQPVYSAGIQTHDQQNMSLIP